MYKNSFLLLGIISFFAACTKPQIELQTTSPASDLLYKVTTYTTGDVADVTTTTEGGTMLMGGSTDVDKAMEWMIEKSGGGDFVVLRVTGSDGYNEYIYDELGGVNSVQTLVITSVASANKTSTYNTIINAEALFIAGGDQWDYVRLWKDTKVEDAIQYLIDVKHVPVGGTSAGCAIQGDVYFDAKNGTVTSSQALNNPYTTKVSLQKSNFITHSLLEQTITDSHYNNPDRKGRHTTFLARMVKDWGLDAKGIGVEEETAVCIDEDGQAVIYGDGNAYFLQQNAAGPETCVSGSKLTWDRSDAALSVYKVAGNASGLNTFNISDWATATGGTWWKFWVENGVFKQAAD